MKEAIEAGQLLAAVEENVPHGQLEQWVKVNCKFGLTQAWKYRNYYQYRANLQACEDLQAADKKVHELKLDEKRREQESKSKLIAEYEETGEKGGGWNRSTDHELKKRQEDVLALAESNQDVEINEGKIVDEVFEKELQRRKVEKGLFSDIEKYITLFEDSLDGIERLTDYLQTRQAELKMKKAALATPISDFTVEKRIEAAAI